MQGLNGLVMGNSKSFNLTAGIQVDDGISSDGASGVRHRNSPKTNLCASIVEVESGAYISRTAFNAEHVNSRNGLHTSTSLDHVSLTQHNDIQGSDAPLSAHQLPDAIKPDMSDSGYLEVDECKQTKTNSNCSCPRHKRESSEVSSLSDQQMRDLTLDATLSEFSSSGGSCQYQPDDIDEDVLYVEIGADEHNDSETEGYDQLLDSMGGSGVEYSGSSTDTTLTTDTDSMQNQLYLNSQSDLTDSPISSPLLSARKDYESSRPSSVFSSPLFGAVSVSGHSRSSSITSTDIDLEATLLEDDEVR